MGDTFHMSAIFEHPTNPRCVVQECGDIRARMRQKRLEQLIQQLSQALEKAPPQQAEAAQAVAETAKSLVDQAAAAKPNKTMLQITGEGLKQAAQNLADVMPAVLAISTQIVAAITRLAG
jgi:hypothetical protein